MRIVDEQTRKLVMQNRIDALEGDNLFDSNFLLEDPDGLDDPDGVGADNKDGGYAGEYVVEEEDESEDISDDGMGLDKSKVKSKRKDKSRAKAQKKN